MHQEAKKVTAACWACPAGTKVVVGYSSGDIILWSVPCPPDPKTEQASQNELSASQITPISKLNLGYKAEKVPIAKLKWAYADGKSSRLYVLGCSNHHSANSLQCQTKSPPSLPKEVIVKLPYGDSSITISKFITSTPCMPCSADEDFNMLAKNNLPLFPFERSLKDGSNSNSTTFSPFSKARNLFITGHSSGAINFWDASCPLLLPLASITQQSDNDFNVSGIPLTALYFSYDSHILVSGDKSGTVRIYTLKSDTFAPQSTFASFQGSSKKGSNHIIRRIKVVKVNGAVLSINTTEALKQLAVGSDQGYVSLIDPEGPSVLYQTHIASELCTGIISMHFETCSFHGFEKNVMIVATKDSSVLALERDTGNTLSSGIVRPSKPSRALFTQILGRGSTVSDGMDVNNINSDNSLPKQSFLLQCSEKAVYTYSLSHLVQGVKKVLYKKKFNSSCYWASTFGSLMLGSVPELSLVKESSIRAVTFSNLRPFSVSDVIVSSSDDGELIIVNGDQELLFVSTLLHKETYRCLDFVSQLLNKDLVTAQGLISSFSTKEKKKGIFSSVIKDSKSTKPKNGQEVETEDSAQSMEELSMIFSAVNFPTDTETEEKIIMNEEDADLDIGKLKHVKGKNDKVPINDEQQLDEKTGAVDQIKKKYGYASSGVSARNHA
ncbi:UNVERIFIED_CONTAM: hypothetical protein Slati_1525500 [Sesamum latifolium]|uniref:Transducin/WD40 repeat-like superfamily protein n=1 Tax=Sesamum latifolium TaxID=2727402 RepID=A0AAW2X7U7_9LAMI